ncbi:sensor histidine kinase [Microbacterium pygmaeum]|nr:PAS domain-containing sensor histidine kinase [Microbacterium pygmaeum]
MSVASRTTALVPLNGVAATPRRPLSTRTRSIWLRQLTLAAVVVVIAVVIAVISPVAFAEPLMLVGIGTLMAVTAATLFIPWGSASPTLIAAVPFADVIGIGIMAFGGDLRMSYLWVFPIAWIAAHYTLVWMISALGLIAAIMVVDGIVHFGNSASVARFVIVLLCLTFIGITIFSTARQTGAFKRLLRRQARRLQYTLDRVSAQERRVTQTLNGLDLAVARVNADGELLSANDAFLALYARDREDPNDPGLAVEYAGFRGEALRDAQRTITRAARGDVLDDERVWLYDPNGQWHTLDITTRPLTAADGEEQSTLIVAQDVTELMRAQRRRDDLAAVISHELRNPLTAILGHVDLILDDNELTPRDQERLEVVERASERMNQMISSILTSPPEREEDPEPPREVVDVRPLLEASVESFLPAAAARGVRLDIDAPSPVVFEADAFRLRQVLDNLVSNAIKYTPREGSVVVGGRMVGEFAELTIVDTGMGMSEDDLDHVFDDYFRAESARESGIPGTGLGMGIVRDIVESHCGTIDLTSTLGEGTTVTARIPLDRAEAERVGAGERA